MATVKAHLANSLAAMDDPSALDAFADAVRMLEESLARTPSDARRVTMLAFALEKYSKLLQSARRTKEAETVYARAIALYADKAGRPNAGPLELNNHASVLAMCPFPKLANAALALELAERARAASGGRSPLILETLAWAYYKNGRVGDAIRTAQNALALVPAAQGAATGMRKSIEASLAEFQASTAVR
jgi:tetratricopeptide (TPR) repeat protein